MTKAVAVEVPTFVKRKHELTELYKSLERATPQAVELLVEDMNNPDLPRKERRAAAEKLIDLQVKVSDVMSKDSLMRQVAEARVNGYVPKLDATGGGQKPQGPSLDFGTIQEVK